MAPFERSVVSIIAEAGFPVYLHSFSAIDAYLGKKNAAAIQVICGADLADLARLFERLRYPGYHFADAAVDQDGKTWYFRCEDAHNIPDSGTWPSTMSFNFLRFYQDCTTSRFYDPHGIYPYLRYLRDGVKPNNAAVQYDAADDAAQWMKAGLHADPWQAVIEGALILARYFPQTGSRTIKAIADSITARLHGPVNTAPVGIEVQQLLLSGLLDAPNPAPGFELLKKCGFISVHWPELAALDEVDHSKEYHPEGNVWSHTMEALRYRKPASGDGGQKSGFDLCLSLGLLLHDIGKPISASAGSRRFDGHAELGERQARRFLERLMFPAPLTHDVCYLVRHHMLPAALPRLPLIRTEEIMASPLFPVLLELYRCDESSSFKGLDGYYQSSAAYQSYLKHRRNPYRSADGKKLQAQGKRRR